MGNENITKIGIECGIEKDINNFSAIKISKDGYKRSCKLCINKIAKISYIKKDNPNYIKKTL